MNEEVNQEYEAFFKASPYQKEKLITLQVHQTIHKKLCLVKNIKGVGITQFMENLVDAWFKQHEKELRQDVKELNKLI